MKILILYTYNKGLLSEFFQELSEKLCANGFEVINFSLKQRKSCFEQNGVSVFSEERRNFASNYKAICKIIKQSRPDVVISNFSYINPAVLFGKLLGVKRNIAWFHTAFGHTKPNRLKVWNKTLYLNMADVVLVNSTALQNELHTVYKVSKAKISCIPFWTNISNYQSNATQLRMSTDEIVINIGCPGRLVADKNHALVIKAHYQLKEINREPFRLFIAGNGVYKDELEALVKDLGLEQEVIFLGLLNVEEMTSFYVAMNVVVLPSLHEAFGLVFIEAISLGTPTLVSSQFGALSFIDNQEDVQNITFNPKSVEDLVLKLKPYFNNSGSSSDYFKHLYKQNFDRNLIYDRLQTIILEA